ncbi:MAG: branched-chain alpha-keto acid dehydrogenase subunit E2 [bacterium]|nr:branched-chain alpha-keto acid dehydrogenase subunit E2 [bacterium]
MASTFAVPELGEGIDAVEVVTILVAVGDRIEVGQPVVEVETDKASVEVPSTITGVVETLHIEVGDSLATGSPVLTVVEDEATQEDGNDNPPDESRNSREAENAETSAPFSEEVIKPTESVKSLPVQEADPRQAESSQAGTKVPAAPSVRRFARELGVDISQVTGSGSEGRLTLDDVKDHARHLLEGPRATSDVHFPRPLPDFKRWGDVEEQPMSKIRRLTAERMDHSWRSVPQVTHNDLANITDLEHTRRRFKAPIEEAGGKLTVTAILVKIVASALKRFPDFNTSLDVERQLVVKKQYINVGVAVDTPSGLLVPVIRNADTKNVKAIAIEMQDLATRARERKLLPDEMQGATFSISNLGGIGGTGFSPIVNWPEVAILGVSRGRVQAEWNGEAFEPRTMLPLSLTYDHRLIDGAEAARFLRWVAEALEEPMLLVLEG